MTKSSYCGLEKLSVHRLVAVVKSRGLGKHPLFTRPPWFVRSLGITQRRDKPGYQVQFEINRCLGGFGYYQVQTPSPCKHSAEAQCLNYPWTKKTLQTKSKLTSVFSLSTAGEPIRSCRASLNCSFLVQNLQLAPQGLVKKSHRVKNVKKLLLHLHKCWTARQAPPSPSSGSQLRSPHRPAHYEHHQLRPERGQTEKIRGKIREKRPAEYLSKTVKLSVIEFVISLRSGLL